MSSNDPLRDAQEYYDYKVLTARVSKDVEATPFDHEMMEHMGRLLDHVKELSFEKARTERHLESLVEIGRSLSQTKEFNALLKSILMESKRATGADAGSIFLIENRTPQDAQHAAADDKSPGAQVLRFKYSHTFSKNLPLEDFFVELTTNSIAGYVAVTGRVQNIADVYNLTSEDPVAFNSRMDTINNYITRSMITVPMRNHYDQIIGVIQLINCKDVPGMAPGESAMSVKLISNAADLNRKVVPFPREYETLLTTIASQAAIAIENSRMVRQIEHQFDQFVRASVKAIESRDKDTNSHSERVADSCIKMALEINSHTEGRFKEISFNESQIRELDYAGLLHDYGKVYVDPMIFLKRKKLYDSDLCALRLRLALLYRSIELSARKQTTLVPAAPLPEPFTGKLNTLKSIIAEITQLNEPTVTDSDPAMRVQAILALQSELLELDLDGQPIQILTADEAKKLSISKGTLTPEERSEIESHVEHSYELLSQIPWPSDLKNIPDIASKHHELLDGSGYCQHISDPDLLPLQSRIMTVADIWDALASDRPYKKAQPFEKCCAILRSDVQKGKLDGDLVELLIHIKTKELDLA